jgi:hypothetical protein
MNVGFGYEASTNGSGADERTVTTVLSRAASVQMLRARPELLVGAAFAGGVVAALLLRRLGR